MRISVFDLVSRYVLPSLRRALVEALALYGIPPSRIASYLGISRSLVTRYLKGERGSLVDFSNDPYVVEVVREIAKGVVENQLTSYDVEEKLIRLSLYLLASRKLCNYHVQLDHSIKPEECGICPRIFTPLTPTVKPREAPLIQKL